MARWRSPPRPWGPMSPSVTRPVVLDVRYLGQARSPFDDTRAGFVATARIDRHDFGVSWNSDMKDGGVVGGAAARSRHRVAGPTRRAPGAPHRAAGAGRA